MKAVILQPMYLPWPGVFEQIRLADIFVHYDDVQLPQGRSFVSRVQIKLAEGTQWLTVPLQRNSRKGLIKDVLIDDTNDWRHDHLINIQRSFKGLPYYQDVINLINQIFSLKTNSLCELNCYAIEIISKYLTLETEFSYSSSFHTTEHSSEKLLAILYKLSANKYITGHGAQNYLNYDLFEEKNIAVNFMNYNILPYNQKFGEFTYYVTILDLISHKGKNALNHLKSNYIYWRKFIDKGDEND